MAGTELLELKNVAKEYRVGGGRLTVLSRLDLEIRAGESVGVYGISGSGKSTLLNIIGGLDRPSAGVVKFKGTDLSRANDAELSAYRARHVGFVFQLHHLLDEFTAVENVMLPLLVQGKKWGAAKEEAMGWLTRFGLQDRASHHPAELSGGEKGRMALARALAGRPELLLADEPTGNLDPKSAAEVAELLLHLNQTEQVAMLVVSHNMELVNRFGHKMELTGGRLEKR